MATLIPTGPGTRHEREDLSDILDMIDPLDTPIYSGLSTSSATAIQIDWDVQELTAANSDNYQAYGADSADSDGLVPVRLNNVTAESTKDGKVAMIYDNIRTVSGGPAGSQNETERQQMLKAYELRRDCEAMITANTAKVASPTPKVAGMPTWFTNVSVGATTGAPPTGDGTDGYTPGDARALDTIAYIQEALTAARTNGGKPSRMYMTPALKPSFSAIPDAAIAGTATINEFTSTSAGPVTQIGAVSNWLSDFGNQEVIVSDHMIAGSILGLDPNHIRKAIVPGGDMVVDPLGKVGASERFQIVHEWSLEVNAPKAHYGVYDLIPA